MAVSVLRMLVVMSTANANNANMLIEIQADKRKHLCMGDELSGRRKTAKDRSNLGS